MNPVQATMTESSPGPFAGRVPGTGAAPFDSAMDRWTDASRADPIAASAAPLAPPLPSQATVQTMADQAPGWQQLGDLPLRLPEALVAQLVAEWQARPGSMLLAAALAVLVLVLSVFALRQALFACNRWLAPVRYPYPDLQAVDWPEITVFIAAHNEERVIADSLQALLASDYPAERMHIVPVNDRSTDATEAIIDRWVQSHPGRIEPFHRRSGKPGKAAALKDAMARAQGDIVLIFDADYTPSPGLLRALVAPFFDAEVGAVMGRVVPRNTASNLLTRLLDLERSAGYQVDQQARMNLGGVPQYGGTVGGVRRSAVDAVGGWRDDSLAEDTDITLRLLVGGWKTVYHNAATCYEEVPQEWAVRLRQVHRWAKGHNQVLLRSWGPLLRSRRVSWRQRLDGLLLLQVFLLQPLLLVGWALALVLYFLNGTGTLTLLMPTALLTAYAAFGGFAAFWQTAAAVVADGRRERLRLLPLQLLGHAASLGVISLALFDLLRDRLSGRELVWAKTVRYRAQPAQEAA